MRLSLLLCFSAGSLGLAGCGLLADVGPPRNDASGLDASRPDASLDASRPDAPGLDAGPESPDAATLDALVLDAGCDCPSLGPCDDPACILTAPGATPECVHRDEPSRCAMDLVCDTGACRPPCVDLAGNLVAKSVCRPAVNAYDTPELCDGASP